MTKTERELAFLRDFDINESWSKRFTDLIDKHVVLKDAANVLYLNAGTGDHCIAIAEKAGMKTSVFATCENDELLAIAKDKGAALRSEVDFSRLDFEDDSFAAVITDASFAQPENVDALVRNSIRVARPGGKVAIVFPAGGSFGEIFSLLWEVLFNEDLGEHGAVAEQMVLDQKTVSQTEELAEAEGLANIEVHMSKEVFEYENGAEFVNSPLIADFLLPKWLESLNEKEKERVVEKLAQLIDAEDGSLTFRFTVKVALLKGEKGKG